MRERRRGVDVQPVGERGRAAERTEPQAVAHGVPDVVRRHGDEQHPRQRAPGVFEASDPHEEAEGQAEDGDEGGAVQRRTVGEGDGSLTHTRKYREVLDKQIIILILVLIYTTMHNIAIQLKNGQH